MHYASATNNGVGKRLRLPFGYDSEAYDPDSEQDEKYSLRHWTLLLFGFTLLPKAADHLSAPVNGNKTDVDPSERGERGENRPL